MDTETPTVDRTPMQIFTRSRGKSPRRVQVVYGAEAARAFCMPRNDARTTRQKRNGFFYEFANLAWYCEAFGR